MLDRLTGRETGVRVQSTFSRGFWCGVKRTMVGRFFELRVMENKAGRQFEAVVSDGGEEGRNDVRVLTS